MSVATARGRWVRIAPAHVAGERPALGVKARG